MQMEMLVLPQNLNSSNEVEDYVIDVIVLTCNNKEILKSFTKAIYSNTVLPFRFILLDNGSSDGTSEFIVEKLEGKRNVISILSPKNLGVIKGRNVGWSYSNSPFICFLDDDQIVHKGWDIQYLSMFDKGFDIVGAEAWLMNSSFFPIEKIKNSNRHFHYVGCGGMMMKKKVYEKIGFFDEIFSPAYFEDPDYNFRAADAGFVVGWNELAKITHLKHQTLGSKNPGSIFAESYKKFFKKWKNRKLSFIREIR